MTAAQAEPSAPAVEPVSLGMELLADRVSLLVLRNIFRGSHRYQQFKDSLGVSHAVLTDRLRHLEAAGLIAPCQYSDRPPRFEYKLTPKGDAYWPVIVSLWRWEAIWIRDSTATLASVRHRECAKVILPWFGCTSCGEEVGLDSPLDVGVSNQTLFDSLSRTAHRYRRAGGPSLASFASTASDGVFTVLRDRWSGLIMLALVKGLTRFSEIQKHLGISPTLLSRRLDEMTALGVVEPVVVPGRAHRAFRMLDKGGDLRPALVLTHLWANEWSETGPRADMLLYHGDHQLQPAWFCDVCGMAIVRPSVDAEGIPDYDETRLAGLS
ncbi:winged helix-turn-helix transcriptional regulator [Desertimonas flava]|jgi:DNA-binding HxlR family transcriptional regulator|uniref:winged helix-turn-helix transcriptional regulator n=1 Tax=Desertimonas flava TaxID=2064846 RepID=UPI000E34C591|nr:winged helix-turn-helix transcriptional regulator [Desertimonas flava]